MLVRSILLFAAFGASAAFAGSYVVQPGDSLSSIAVGIVKSSDNAAISAVIEDIVRKNSIADANNIAVGATLTVPAAGEAPAWKGDLYDAVRYPDRSGEVASVSGSAAPSRQDRFDACCRRATGNIDCNNAAGALDGGAVAACSASVGP